MWVQEVITLQSQKIRLEVFISWFTQDSNPQLRDSSMQETQRLPDLANIKL